MNHKEVANQVARIAKMEGEGKDEYDIKKQNEVLAECEMMIPDTQGRLATAFEDLSAVLKECSDLAELEDYTAAAAMLKTVPIEDAEAK